MVARNRAVVGEAGEGVPFGGAFRSTNLDLGLALLVAVGLPAAAAWLLARTGGAAASLLVYYGVCCLALVRWRKGTLDYRRHWPARWPWAIFLPCLLLPLASAAINRGALSDAGASPAGLWATLLVWAPLNGATEQLAWFYVLDAWRNRWRRGAGRWVGLAVGVGLLLVLVAAIHVLFWARFLPLAEPTPLTPFAIPLNLLLTVAYGLLYYRTRSMWPVFALHSLVDVQLVVLGNYSILPDM